MFNNLIFLSVIILYVIYNEKRYFELTVELNQKNQLINSQIFLSENQLNSMNTYINNILQQLELLKSNLSDIENKYSLLLQSKTIKKCPNGIFDYFLNKYRDNLVEKGIIKITGNSENDANERKMFNILDPKWDSWWCSKDEKNSFFIVNFLNFSVKANKYSIRMGRRGQRDRFFRSWILEGITKDNQTIKLDEVSNTKEITSSNPELLREIKNESLIRSFKMIMKGKSDCGDYFMRVRNFEIFGILYKDN